MTYVTDFLARSLKACAFTVLLYGVYRYGREVCNWTVGQVIQLIYWSPWVVAVCIISRILYKVFQVQLQPYIKLAEPLSMWIYWELSKKMRAHVKNSNKSFSNMVHSWTIGNDPTLIENIPSNLPADPGPMPMSLRIESVTDLIQRQLRSWNDLTATGQELRLTRFHSHEGTFDQPNFLIQVLENNKDCVVNSSGSMKQALEEVAKEMQSTIEPEVGRHHLESVNAQLFELRKELRALELVTGVKAAEAVEQVQPFLGGNATGTSHKALQAELTAVIVIHDNPVALYKGMHDEAHEKLQQARRNWTKGDDEPNEKEILDFEKQITPLARKVFAGTGARFTWITDGTSWLFVKLEGELVTSGAKRIVPYSWHNRPHPNGPFHNADNPEFAPGPKSAQNSLVVSWACGKSESDGNIRAAMHQSIRDAIGCCKYSTLIPTKDVIRLYYLHMKVTKLSMRLSQPRTTEEQMHRLQLAYQDMARARAKQNNILRAKQLVLAERRLHRLDQELRMQTWARQR